MKFTTLLSILSLVLNQLTYAQEKKFNNGGFYTNDVNQVCNGAAALSDEEVVNLVTTICEKTNNRNRFVIAPCTQVPNCYATVHNNRPYILYNAQFLNSVKGLQFTNAKLPTGVVDWKVMTLLAHEIGHHIYMHLTNPDPNMTDRDMELEADEFAGYSIYMLGGTLQEAQAVMYNSNVGEKDTYTHPGREKRIDAIAKGYNHARNMFPKQTENVLPEISETDAKVRDELAMADLDYKKGNYDATFAVYSKYKNHKLFTPKQIGKLGFMYGYGKGTNINYDEALVYYTKAAEQGEFWVCTNMGAMYYNGNGVTKNFSTAIYWFRKAAEQGNPEGQTSLGTMYFDGYGVTQDYATGVYWYTKAAEQGNILGELFLGNAYENGQGVTKDLAKAFSWYKKAAEQGDAGAQTNVSRMYENGEVVALDYKEAFIWSQKAANQGDDNGQANLGRFYLNGRGVQQDFDKALYWFKKSAEQSNETAQANLGFMYENGKGVEKNIDIAKEYYKNSAKRGNQYAQTSCNRLGITW